MNKELTLSEMEDLQYSPEYANYIMDSDSDRPICNGNMLTEAMEEGFLFEEFVTSIGRSLP